MSNKLSNDDYMDSLEALRKFRNDLPSMDLRKNIIIITNNNEIKSYDDVEVIVAERFPNYQIDIYWEGVLENFKDLGLRGTYNPQYTSISYNDKELIIVDQGNKIIIK